MKLIQTRQTSTSKDTATESSTRKNTRVTPMKLLAITATSLALTACGGGSSDNQSFVKRISAYQGNWQSACRYDSSTRLSSMDTLYITDTAYSFFTDVFDNNSCAGNSRASTEINGYLYFGADRTDASAYCNNAIEVDFSATAIRENGVRLPNSQISRFLDLPSNVSYNLMCTHNNQLFTGDLSEKDGSSEAQRPYSVALDRPFTKF